MATKPKAMTKDEKLTEIFAIIGFFTVIFVIAAVLVFVSWGVFDYLHYLTYGPGFSECKAAWPMRYP